MLQFKQNVAFSYPDHLWHAASQSIEEDCSTPAVSDDPHLPQQLFPTGSVHEIFFRTPFQKDEMLFCPRFLPASLALRSLQQNGQKAAKKLIIWIGRESWPSAYALDEILQTLGLEDISFKNFIFIELPDPARLFWTIDTSLRTEAVGAVIAACRSLPLATSRRFFLSAQRSNTLGIFLRPEKEAVFPSAAHSRWHLAPAPSETLTQEWELRLQKIKGAQPEQRAWRLHS